MHHNYVKDEKFNILTAKREKGFLTFTGETHDPIEVGDTINYPFGGDKMICVVDKIIERRDSKSYPKGNGLFYTCECSGISFDDIKTA
jgi:hypothetical protein